MPPHSLGSRRRSRRRNNPRQQPKRMFGLGKSRYVKRWLIRNPWIRPMFVFNYAAIKIQQHYRGHLLRRHPYSFMKTESKTKSLSGGPTQTNKRGTGRQLDKYLSFLDFCKAHANKSKPMWLDGGYSAWCAVRVQAFWRMSRVRKRYIRTLRLINQVAAIVIQSKWRSKYYRTHSSSLLRRARIASNSYLAAEVIQLAWRSFCNWRVYKYFRDLIKFKLKGAPAELLRTIVPKEVEVLDKAAGIHVRFRLGGVIFPPKIYFKIFTHRPLCDVNAFAPRNYAKEKPVVTSNFNDNIRGYVDTLRSSRKVAITSKIRVGARYFGTKVTTTVDTEHWYKRDENNNWRPIASQLFEDLFTPPWAQSGTIGASTKSNKLQPYHFSRLRRKEDILKDKKRRKREWMLKAYMIEANNGRNGAEAYRSSPSPSPPPREFSHTNRLGQSFPERQIFESRSEIRLPQIAAQGHSGINGDIKGVADGLKISSMDAIKLPALPSSGAVVRSLSAHPKTSARVLYGAAATDGLVDWSLALDYEEYVKGWENLGTSMPSDVNVDFMYSVAGAENKQLQQEFYGTS